MAVMDRSYKRWDGDPMPHWQRLLVIPEHGLREVFKRKLVRFLYILSLLPSLMLLIAAFVTTHLDDLLALFPFLSELELDIGATAYHVFFRFQSFILFLLTLAGGPSLISRDLTNQALPLYLSKSLSRTDYVLGKGLVLLVLLAGASLLPLCTVYCLHWFWADSDWRSEYGWLLSSLLTSGGAKILFLTIFVLAISAYVRRARLAWVGLIGLFLLPWMCSRGFEEAARTRVAEVAAPKVLLSSIETWAFIDRQAARAISNKNPVEKAIAETHDLVESRRPAPLTMPVVFAALLGWLSAGLFAIYRKLRPVEVIG
ncbi:MAG: hypothetical protein AAF533_19365 [Acidobacteriota bacterium]